MSEPQRDRGADVVAEMTHEGRNALQQIQAGLRLLKFAVGDLGGEASELLKDLDKPIRRLDRLFEDIDDYSAPLEANVGTCDAGEAWRTVCARINGAGAAAKLEPCRVRGDPFLLEEALWRIAEWLAGWPPDVSRIVVRSENVPGTQPTIRLTLRRHGTHNASSKSRGRDTVSLAIAERFIEAQGGELRGRVDGDVREVSLYLRKDTGGD